MIVSWMLYAGAVSALLAGAAWVLERALRPRRRGTRWGWLAAMLLSVAIPAFRLATPAPPAEPVVVAQAPPPAESAPTWTEPAAAGVTTAAALAAEPTLPAFTPVGQAPVAGRMERAAPLAWAGASALLCLLLLLGWAQLLLRSRRWRRGNIDGEPVLLSPDTGPAVIGVVRSSIVLPEWVTTMEPEERRLILRHERAHVSARDPLLVAVGMATVLLTPWNLALWWMLCRLRLAVETDCDARVLRGQAGVRGYARLLLSLAERSAGVLPAGAPAFAEPRSFLERRIRAMTTPRPSRRRGLAAALLTAALVPALAFALPSPPSPRAAAATLVLPLGPVTVRGRPAPPPAPSVPVTGSEQGSAADTIAARFEPSAVDALAQREFPADMRQREIEGAVTLRFTIDPAGRARDIEAISQSGLEFVEPAKRVAQQLQFQPARLADRTVAQSVPNFQVNFRLRPRTGTARTPTNAEVLLRAAIAQYYPDLLREEPARTPRVYMVVDERGNVVRRALDWSGIRHPAPREQMLARFPDLSGQTIDVSITRVQTGIPGGRDVPVYWAVVKQPAQPAGPIAWGPYPLAAVSIPMVPPEVVRRLARERYPEIVQRASSEGIWFIGHPDGEVLHTGTGRLPSGGPAARYLSAGGIVTFVEAAAGGATQVYWVVPQVTTPSDPNVISGIVRDAAGNPVAGAVVLLRDRRLGATTGADGRFAFRAAGVPAGTHAILARHPAGAPAVTSQVTFQPGSSVAVDFTLPAR